MVLSPKNPVFDPDGNCLVYFLFSADAPLTFILLILTFNI